MLKKRIAMLVMALVSLSLLTGKGQSEDKKTLEKKIKEVTIGIAGDAYSLDPYPLNESITNAVNLHIFEPVVLMNTNLEIEPALATDWKANDEATVWTFNLRKNVKFHNGNDFTADDVVYSFHRGKSEMSAFDGMLSTVDKIKKIDEFTVELELNQPNVLLLSQLKDILIMDKETCDGKTDEEIALIPNGTGKYILVEHVREDKIVFKRNEDYWGNKPEAEKVTFKPIGNEGTRTANILSGAVDLITDVPVRDTEMIKKNNKISILTTPSLRVIYLNMAGWSATPSRDAKMPLKSPDGTNPLQDIRVREAMYRAIDENTIIKQIMNGFATPAATYIPEGFNGYNSSVKRFAYDKAKAEKLLDEAGYKRQADGYRFELTLDASNDRYINDADIATAVAGYLEKVGIKVNLNLMSRTVFFSYISASNKSGDNTHLCMTGWADGAGESTLMGMDMLYSKTQDGEIKSGFGGVNRGFYRNSEVDSLVETAISTLDPVKRDKMMQKAWKIAADEVSYIPLHFQQDVYAVNEKITFTPRYNKYVFAWDISFN